VREATRHLRQVSARHVIRQQRILAYEKET
jgi:hypothetical protein